MIIKAKMKDLSNIMDIYASARQFMKENGNPLQWGEDRPSKKQIEEDIDLSNSYIVIDQGELCGVFTFILGKDPTYEFIEEGKWINDEAYGTIHRLASNGKKRGVFNQCIEYCLKECDNIRIDTHRDNKIMINLIEKAGFKRCGIIHVEDGSPRIAYQKINDRF